MKPKWTVMNDIFKKRHQGEALILHVGCGSSGEEKLPTVFKTANCRQIRLDIEPGVNPDIVGDIRNMEAVPEATVQGVFSSHNLEHVFPHEVDTVLKEFHRVLSPGGVAIVTMPDIGVVARAIVERGLEAPLYQSPAGPISPIDILYGHRASLARGHVYMAHKTGFSLQSLESHLLRAGFEAVHCVADEKTYNLWGLGYKPPAPASPMRFNF